MSTQLQILTSQFNTILNEYQETSKKYTELIEKKDTTLTQIPDYSFFGESNLNILGSSNVSSCQNACVENKSCSGATFNTTSNNCTLSSGKGNIVHTAKSVAIVQQAMYYSNRLKELNIQLTILSEKIITISNQSYNQYSKNKTLNKKEEVIMVNNYNVLIEERKEIDSIIKNFQTLDAAYEDGNINVNANYMNYVVFLFVVVFLILLLLSSALSSPQFGGGVNITLPKFIKFL
jgi:hypothetical protein